MDNEAMLIETYENKSLEKYGFIGKDPIDEGNIFSNFIMYWAYKIIHLSIFLMDII